ncbi:hypothetical protein J8L70_00640 [Pseudoalteromonas sp. MMG010]|uniref:DUF6170 family protein n=1 Tax=Pseudoalteromonas sp. MMG010 TaxID=2822685 RepID=UPI001B3A7762|nr:DUF6170 family protein [Pseudoalteromonas sp. MMG010]MBQ4831743.1 hypothetical protein [Pseudoalteromonas sp. MMG010]
MFIFFTSQISELKHLKLRQRQQTVAQALALLSPVNTILLKIIKLCFIFPVFFILNVFEGWLLVPFLLLVGLSYPLITTPIEIMFAKKHLSQVLTTNTEH